MLPVAIVVTPLAPPLTPRLEHFFLCGMEAAAAAPRGTFKPQELAAVAWSAAAAGATGSVAPCPPPPSSSFSPTTAAPAPLFVRSRAVGAWERLADAVADALEEANGADRRAAAAKEEEEGANDDDDGDVDDDGGVRAKERPPLAFEPQGVSMLCWALARARVRHPRLLDAAARHALRHSARYDAQAASNLLWSLATLRHSPVFASDDGSENALGLVEVAGRRIEEALEESGVEELALGGGRETKTANARSPSSNSSSSRPSISPAEAAQALANYAWAAATLGELTPRALGRLSRRWEALLLGDPTSRGRGNGQGKNQQKNKNRPQEQRFHATIEGLGQLWQADALARASSRLSPCPRALTPALADAADAAQRRAALSGAWATGFANAVFATAQKCPSASSNVVAEVAVCGAAHRVDVVVETLRGTKCAVEADGPPHFLLSHPTDPDGGTANRNVTLAAEGWVVVPVPYFEWDAAVAAAAAAASSSSHSSSAASPSHEHDNEQGRIQEDAAVAYLEGKLRAADAAARELGGGGGCVVVSCRSGGGGGGGGSGDGGVLSSNRFLTPREAAALGPPSDLNHRDSSDDKREEGGEVKVAASEAARAWGLSSRSGWRRRR